LLRNDAAPDSGKGGHGGTALKHLCRRGRTVPGSRTCPGGSARL